MKSKIPFFDISRQNEFLKEELLSKISGLIDSGKFILGENVRGLETDIAEYCGTKYAVGVANGSDALYLSLVACGIGPGDEVITTPFTFYATAGSIVRAGAIPVFVDIDHSFNIDPTLIEEKVTSKTKAIIPVHLFGLSVDMSLIMDIAKTHDLKVVEDSAQAIGTTPLGDTGCLSFFPTKNLGCFGDGGMIVTDNQELAERISLLRVHGAKDKYHHDLPGINSRLDEIQALILRHKLPFLDGWVAQRKEIARTYNNVLGVSDTESVYNQYTIRIKNRNSLQTHLKENGIDTAVYYPSPLHLQEVFKDLGYRKGDFPQAEKTCRDVLSLPIFPELTDKEVYWIVKSCCDWFR